MSLFLINVHTHEYRRLTTPFEWFIYSGAPIPNTRLIMIGARLRSDTHSNAAQILTLDIDTLELRDIGYDALNDAHTAIEKWNFSPDGRYTLYWGASTPLIEVRSGRLIYEFPYLATAGWLDNETVIIKQSFFTDILRMNAATGELNTVLSGEAATGFLLIP